MRTPPRRIVLAAAGFAAATALAGCASDPQIADVTTIAPPPTAAPTTAPTTAPATAPTTTTAPATDDTPPPSASTAPDTTAPDTTTPASTLDPTGTLVPGPATGPMFSDDLGERVTSAPGVRTPGDTRRLLPDGLYIHLAWTADPTDPSVFTPTPDDIPILEAYANVSLAYYRAALSSRTTDDPAFDRYMLDGGAQYDDAFGQALREGYIGSLGNGVILRPYVLQDRTSETTATVLDCYLQNEQYILEGSSPDLKPLEPKGTLATLVRDADGWKVDTITSEPRACL